MSAAHQPEPSGVERPFELFPLVLVRVPGVPRSRLDAYRHRAALALDDAAREAKGRLSQEGARLHERLHDLVPQLATREHRRAILAARRRLFHAERVPDGEWRGEVRRLDAALAGELDAYDALTRELEQTLAARDARFDADALLVHDALLSLLGEPRFRLGLTLANRAVAEQVARVRPGATPSKRERQALGRAMRYLLRAALKPTPLGFFASTAVSTVRAEGADTASSLASFAERAPRLRPNRAFLQRVADALLRHPPVRARAGVYVSPACFIDEGRVFAPDADERGYVELPIPAEVAKRLLALGRNAVPYGDLAERAGLSPQQVEALCGAGVVQINLGASEEEVDDIPAMLRLLWEAVPGDLSLLSVIALLSEIDAAIAAVAGLDPDERARALQELEQKALSLPGVRDDEPPPPLVFEETACANAPPVPAEQWSHFLRDIVSYGAALVYPHLLAEEQTLLTLFRQWNPRGQRVPLLRFHRQYLDHAREHGLGVDHYANSHALHRMLGLTTNDPVPRLASRLARVLAAAGRGEAVYHPEPDELDGWAPGPPTRLSIRLAPAPAGPAGPRFHLVFWGAERMSLVPRYSDLPGPASAELPPMFRRWMRRWPEVADMHGSLGRNVDTRRVFTERTVDMPGASPRPAGVALRDLFVIEGPDDGRLIVVDATGEVVSPVFFGVSAPSRLPPMVQFMLHLTGRRTSFVELLTRALNRVILDAASAPTRAPHHLPALYLGDHILLSPRVIVLDPAALPPIGATVDRAGFFAFHDWLAEHGMPRLAQVRVDHRDPLWIDFQHPEGVSSFLRLVHGASVALVYPPILPDGEPGLRAEEGDYDVEYYVELAMGKPAVAADT